jgi:hypothetical protein
LCYQIVGSSLLGRDAAEALNDSLILGLFTGGTGVDPPFVAEVGDIGPEGVPVVTVPPTIVDA